MKHLYRGFDYFHACKEDEMKYRVVERIPSWQEYNHLWKTVGWRFHEREVVEESLLKSQYCVCALTKTGIVGMARVVGDDRLTHYIQDAIVIPECQGYGIGAAMMEKIMAHKNSVGLMASAAG